jgi:hypothetical protein
MILRVNSKYLCEKSVEVFHGSAVCLLCGGSGHTYFIGHAAEC